MGYNLLQEIDGAFSQQGCPSFPKRRDQGKETFLRQMAATVTQHKNIGVLLLQLKDSSPTHYYHSIRVGVTYRDVVNREKILESVVSSSTLDIAGLLHDAGKICIENEILEGGNLNDHEKKIMKAHNRLTALHLRRIEKDSFPYLRAITTSHHSYPREEKERRQEQRRELSFTIDCEDERSVEERREKTRREKNQSLEKPTAILKMCDIYDALASRRSYKEAFPQKEIRDFFQSHFPHCDETIIEYLLDNYPSKIS